MTDSQNARIVLNSTDAGNIQNIADSIIEGLNENTIEIVGIEQSGNPIFTATQIDKIQKAAALENGTTRFSSDNSATKFTVRLKNDTYMDIEITLK